MIHIVILGRPNVGKSTLFNRLIRKRKSIVEPTPGVTRDVNKEEITLGDTEAVLYDTGGLLEKSDDVLNDQVREKALGAAKNIDVILFVVDANQSHPDDKYFIKEIRKLNKPVILVANKVDTESRDNLVYEFINLGINTIVPVSAEHGRGINDLIEAIEDLGIESENKSEKNEDEITIAIVGKPNAGKSTLLNTILGEERSIVNPIAGTTRDSIDVHFNFLGDSVCLVDTAGMRKKKNVSESVEYYSVNRAVHAIENSDVCILMLDMTEGLTDQDKRIASLIVERRKGVVIAANKWDIREKGTTWNDYEAYMKNEFPVLSYAMYTKLSATHKQSADKLLQLAIRVAKTRTIEISTHALTESMVRATREYTVSAGKTSFKIFYVTQIGTKPPVLAIFSNHPDKINAHYKRYLENKLRQMFDFRGTPIVMQFRKQDKDKKN